MTDIETIIAIVSRMLKKAKSDRAHHLHHSRQIEAAASSIRIAALVEVIDAIKKADRV